MALRERVEAGVLVGPRIRTSGMTVGDPQEATAVVDSLTALGADFIKIRHAESPEVFAALADAAADAGTHLVGHYVWILSLEESADAGQRSIEASIAATDAGSGS